ncbi:MAG: hypothetical protein LLG08_00785 [Actinomycetia bacterium]|nr:hypothetical protein [Actinomycetes bacterium]
MQTISLVGPLAVFLIALAFGLVVAALVVVVHALGRRADRWKHPWMRWIWVALAAEYILAFAVAFMVRQDVTATIFGFSYVVALVADITYLLRVVFPATPVPERTPPQSSAPDATVMSDTTPGEQSPDA